MKPNPSRALAKRVFSIIRRVPGTNGSLMWLGFLLAHKRIPLWRTGFNDLLYKVKARELQDPLRCFVSDKIHVKDFVSARVGDIYNIPTLAAVDDAAELQNRTFEMDTVVKPAHLSGEVIFLKRGDTLSDVQLLQVGKWLNRDLFKTTGELNYKHLRRRVIVEKALHFNIIVDYKFFCSAGKIIFVQVDQDRFGVHKRVNYDRNWTLLPFTINADKGEHQPRPPSLSTMCEIARKLSLDFSFVRVDLYAEGDEVFVGEITNCHGSAQEIFRPRRYDEIVGEFISSDQLEVPLDTFIKTRAGALKA